MVAEVATLVGLVLATQSTPVGKENGNFQKRDFNKGFSTMDFQQGVREEERGKREGAKKSVEGNRGREAGEEAMGPK